MAHLEETEQGLLDGLHDETNHLALLQTQPDIDRIGAVLLAGRIGHRDDRLR